MLANIVYYLLGHWLGINSPIALPLSVLAFLLVIVTALTAFIAMSNVLSPDYRRIFYRFIFVVTGFSIPQLYGTYHFEEWRPKLGKHLYQIEGVVLARQAKPYGDVVYLGLSRVDSISMSSFWGYKKAKVLFTTDHLKTLEDFEINDTVRFSAKLSQITGYENRFGFNYTQWLFGHSVLATGTYKQDFARLRLGSNSSQRALVELKQALSQYQYGKFILALVIADKSLFDQQDFVQLRNWGISHLFAISGLHIGILMGLMIVLCRQLSRVIPMFCSMGFCHLISVLLIWWYLSVLAFPVSATRATLLLTLGLGLLHCHMYLQAFNLIGLVMVASLILDPANMVKPAWWLSVSAVCSLFLIMRLWPHSTDKPSVDENKHIEEISESNNIKREVKSREERNSVSPDTDKTVHENISVIDNLFYGRFFKVAFRPAGLLFAKNKHRFINVFNSLTLNFNRLFILQIALTVGMLPVVIYWMQGVPVLGLINNMIVIPIFSIVIVPAIFLGTIVQIISETDGNWIYLGVDVLFRWLWSLLEVIPFNDTWIVVPEYFAWPVLIILILLVWYHAFGRLSAIHWLQVLKGLSAGSKMTKWGVVGMVTISMIVLIYGFFNLNFFNKNTTIRIVDVGQGTSVTISNKDTNIIYDLGPVFQSGSSATRHAVRPMLDNLLIDTLDLVVISHSDTDHRGDLSALDTFVIKQHLNSCKNYRSLQNDYSKMGLEFTLLWPTRDVLHKIHSNQRNKNSLVIKNKQLQPRSSQFTDNALSCVIKIKDLSSDKSLLLTGDIDLTVEKTLSEMHLNNKINLRSDIVMSSHHGSKFGSSTLFMRLVAPTLVIHSAGPNNRFNFPHPDVIKRIAELGIKQYSTSQRGEIVITLQQGLLGGEDVNFQLDQWSAFWKRQNPFSIHDQIR